MVTSGNVGVAAGVRLNRGAEAGCQTPSSSTYVEHSRRDRQSCRSSRPPNRLEALAPYSFRFHAIQVLEFSYTGDMVQRTTVEFDSEQLAEVRKLLGTTGIKDTIDAAFDQIVRQARRLALLDQLRDPEKFDFSEEVFRQARPLAP